jgi:hypothetical protein
MSPGPFFRDSTLDALSAVCEVVLDRGNREVLLDCVYRHPGQLTYCARVSCDGGRTWGRQIVSLGEVLEVMGLFVKPVAGGGHPDGSLHRSS